MICNMHSGNNAWLASLRSNIITMFELMDHGHDGYFHIYDDDADLIAEYDFSDVLECLAAEGIESGDDLNKRLREWEAEGLDKKAIESELYAILDLYDDLE